MRGFYKKDCDLLVWSADKVINDFLSLVIDDKESYSYPVDGWIWAENESQARQELKCYGIKCHEQAVIDKNTCQWVCDNDAHKL